VGLNLYRSQQVLSPEKLAEARRRWEAAGIKDYDIRVATTGSARGTYFLKIRGGKPVQASMEDVPLAAGSPQVYPWTVPGLFDALQGFLDWDSDPSHATAHTEVVFDLEDGHLVHFLRNAPGQRIVIDVQLDRK
jgi:hypothetical protein